MTTDKINYGSPQPTIEYGDPKIERPSMTTPFKPYSLALAILACTPCAISSAQTAFEPNQVGRTIASFALQDFRGKTWSLDELQGKKATVIAFLGVECPIAAQYAMRLKT